MYDIINEKRSLSVWRDLIKNVQKDLKINLFFVSTFGLGIGSFMPVILNLMKNHKLEFDLNPKNITMLTICAIAIITNDNKEAIDKLKNKLKENNILDLLDEVIISIKSIKNILVKVFIKIGEVLTTPAGLMDLLAYTSILTPIMNIFNNLVIENGIGIETLQSISNSISDKGSLLAIGFSLTTLVAKKFLTNFLNKVKEFFNKDKKNENANIKIERNYEPILSNFKLEILESIKNNPLRISDIVKQKKVSIKFIYETIRILNSYGFINKKDNFIYISEKGKEYLNDINEKIKNILNIISEEKDLKKIIKKIDKNDINEIKEIIKNIYMKKLITDKEDNKVELTKKGEKFLQKTNEPILENRRILDFKSFKKL